jgi:hypothetical protein
MRQEDDDESVISYQAARPGTPILSSDRNQIGTLEHVLEVPELDVFDGMVVATRHGLRFIDADQDRQFRLGEIRCTIGDEEAAAQLPPPAGPPVYRVDALANSGHDMHDVLGRFFGCPHWTRNRD